MTKKMVFDIECVGVDFDGLDETSQHNLLRRYKTEEDREEEKTKLALYPVTGFVVGIGMINPDTDKGKMLYLVDKEYGKAQHRKEGDEDTLYVPCLSEKDLLDKFWEDVAQYDQVISFNGRGFDAPYIIIRSMVHGLVPTKDLMPNRFGDFRTKFNAHLDLADQLSFYGAMRKFSLHLFTTAMGITSPKEEGDDGEVVDGLAVPRLFEAKKYDVIAEYCMRDVVATTELYRRWEASAHFRG